MFSRNWEKERKLLEGRIHRWLKNSSRTSLVVQWLRICLQKQGSQIWSLVWEDPTRHGTAKPASLNPWDHLLQLLKPKCPRAGTVQERPLQWEAWAQQWRPRQPKRAESLKKKNLLQLCLFIAKKYMMELTEVWDRTGQKWSVEVPERREELSMLDTVRETLALFEDDFSYR